MASFPRILAIDVGETEVRALDVGPDSHGGPSIQGWEAVPLAAKEEGRSAALAGAFQALSGRLAGRGRETILCLGGPSVFSRIIKIPMVDSAKIESMVRFEAQQTVPAIEQALWDYQLLPSSQPGEAEALLLAIKRDLADEVIAAANEAGLRPRHLDLTPSALLNAFRFNYPEARDGSLILEIGARATVILLTEGTKFFCRVVPLGGGAVTQGIATDLELPLAEAEQLKRQQGFVHPGGFYEDPSDPSVARAAKLARGVMSRIHTEVERSITFFRSQQGGSKPSRILLAGGGCLLGYSDLFFQEKLQAPAAWFQPFRRVGVRPGLDPGKVGRSFPAWASAMGAALQVLPAAPSKINVLASKTRRAGGAPERLAKVVAGAAGAALLLLPAGHMFWQARHLAAQLAPRASEVDQAEKAWRDLEAEKKLLQEARRRLDQALALSRERTEWAHLFGELQKQIQDGMWITELGILENSPGSSAEAVRGEGKKSEALSPVRILEIVGMFETRSKEADARAVESFREALETGGVVQKVELIEREAPREVEGQTEQVALGFRLRAEWPRAPGLNETLPDGKRRKP